MSKLTLTAGFGMLMALGAVFALAADTRSEARLDIAPGGTLSVVDGTGSVTVHSGTGRQIVLVSTARSAKVEMIQSATADKKRVEVRTQTKDGQNPSAEEAQIEYEITVPAGVSVTITTATAPITVEGVSGDIVNLSSDTGAIVARGIAKAHVHVRSVTGPVTLSGITAGHVEITSAGGAVQLTNVSGPLVNVGTTNGNISYQGDCSGAGAYTLTTHSGAIDVTLPGTASVELNARSVTGQVQNDFPLQQKASASFVPKTGSSFIGTSRNGSSSLELQSFSGRIRVKKQ